MIAAPSPLLRDKGATARRGRIGRHCGFLNRGPEALWNGWRIFGAARIGPPARTCAKRSKPDHVQIPKGRNLPWRAWTNPLRTPRALPRARTFADRARERAGEVGLIGESDIECDFRQRTVGVEQKQLRLVDPRLQQPLVRREPG